VAVFVAFVAGFLRFSSGLFPDFCSVFLAMYSRNSSFFRGVLQKKNPGAICSRGGFYGEVWVLVLLGLFMQIGIRGSATDKPELPLYERHAFRPGPFARLRSSLC
jgi:hypothetical protein